MDWKTDHLVMEEKNGAEGLGEQGWVKSRIQQASFQYTLHLHLHSLHILLPIS